MIRIMSHLWAQTITINQDLAQRLVEQQTDLIVSSIEILAEGWDNVAYLINKQFVFRFPRREFGLDCMENELVILPYLAKNISFPFSNPIYIGKPSDIYPASFAGYPILQGNPLSDLNVAFIHDEKFAQTLGKWLKELHSIPICNEHHTKIKGDQLWRTDLPDIVERSNKRIVQYESYFEEAGFHKNELFSAVEKVSQLKINNLDKKSYIHGDLYSKHLLVDNQKDPCGIIDWGDIHIGNPGIDLSIGLMIFSDPALQVFFDSYGTLTGEMKTRAMIRALQHPIALLPYCYERGEERLKNWTILALTKAVTEVLKA